MHLSEYLDEQSLKTLIEGGFVSVRNHDEFPLRILNYTKKASGIRADNWPDALLKCRGLIIDQDDIIIAMGVRKFWNVERTTWLKKPLTVCDKLDGSLGVVYQWDGVPYVATRGSFHSEMAGWANEFLDKNPNYREWLTDDTGSLLLTPHVEIIYHGNRIVVDYDYEDLVLLGYNDDVDWTPAQQHWTYPGRIAQSFQFDSLKDIFKSDYRPNSEGFVIVDAKGQMKKYKYQEYLDLHRAVSNMTERAIYNKLVAGEANDFILSLPDEFQDDAREIKAVLMQKYFDKTFEFSKYAAELSSAVDMRDRKSVAIYMQQNDYPGWVRASVFCSMDDNKAGFRLNMWKQVQP